MQYCVYLCILSMFLKAFHPNIVFSTNVCYPLLNRYNCFQVKLDFFCCLYDQLSLFLEFRILFLFLSKHITIFDLRIKWLLSKYYPEMKFKLGRYLNSKCMKVVREVCSTFIVCFSLAVKLNRILSSLN